MEGAWTSRPYNPITIVILTKDPLSRTRHSIMNIIIYQDKSPKYENKYWVSSENQLTSIGRWDFPHWGPPQTSPGTPSWQGPSRSPWSDCWPRVEPLGWLYPVPESPWTIAVAGLLPGGGDEDRRVKNLSKKISKNNFNIQNWKLRPVVSWKSLLKFICICRRFLF